tara:strand:+ start:31 stop:618 length:588 start_codon:yes stop_codon:yes gene_type:complete
MSIIIKDGTGNNISAKVDASHRLLTTATTQSGFKSAQKKGDAFVISTNIITLTSANESAVLYLQLSETSPLVIENLSFRTGASTGGSTTDVIRTDYVQPTTGTLISDATPASVINTLASSTKTLDAVVYQGDEAKTIGGEIVTDQSLHITGQIKDDTTGLIVPQGTAIGISVTPPPGNTSLKIQIIVTVYLLDSE